MGYNVRDIYYNPEEFGLETIGELELSSGTYEFDIVLVQRSTLTGAFYINRDMGCSCPSPFEGVDSVGKPYTKNEAIAEILKYFPDEWGAKPAKYAADRAQLIAKIRAL